MSSLIRLRLILLGLGLAAMTALTLWGVETSWERISTLEQRLTSGYLESFRLADHFQERVLRLNNSMLRFAAQREQQTWVEFEQAGRDLDGWIDEQQPGLGTPMERQMLDALNTAYDNYLAAARAVRRHDQPSTVSPAAFAQLEDFERQAQLLLQLGIRLTEAQRGTLFLDEIGDLNPNTQVKLLRVLQERTIQRVGGAETIPVDVRVIAATHRDFELMMRENRFREDLFYRLSVVTVRLPALRERREDVAPLARHFLWRYAGEFNLPLPNFAPEAVRRVLSARRQSDASGDTGLRAMAADFLARAQRGELSDAHGRLLAEAERAILTQAIDLAEGNQARASRWLGLSRLTLREKLTQLGRHPRQQAASAPEAAEG